MKKQLITLLMAGLLVVGFGGSALAADATGSEDADGNVTVTAANTVVEGVIPVDFVVVIPEKITPKAGAEIKASKMIIGPGKAVTVTAGVKDANGSFTLNGTTTGNTEKKIDAVLTHDALFADPIASTDVVAKFSTINAHDADADTGNVYVKMPAYTDGVFADTYAGTLNFTVTYGAAI